MRPALLAAALLVLAALPARALRVETMPGPRVAGKARAMEVVAGQVLAQFDASASSAAYLHALSSLGCRLISRLPGGWAVVALPASLSVPAGLSLLKGTPGILALSPDHVYRPNLAPNDPLASEQWALNNIDAFRGWSLGTGQGAQKVTIAMIDTGIDTTNPDLSAKVPSTGNMFFDPDNGGNARADNPPAIACEHGTETAGVAAASSDNGVGIAGLSWGAQLLSLRVFNPNDCNSDCTDKSPNTCGTDDAAMANAISYAISEQNMASYGKIVINMSLGSDNTACSSNPLTQTALQNAISSGIPAAISAGNYADAINSPANCAGTTPGSGIMPVGATTQNNTVATSADWGAGFGSSYGPELAANGVVAPGTNIETTEPGNNYAGGNDGTSFAAPYVAGLAALILSAKPSDTPQMVQALIRNTAQNIGADADHQGAGLIDVYVALSSAASGNAPAATSVGGPDVFTYPNPFRITSQNLVFFNLPANFQTASPTIKIYTVNGQLVATLSTRTWNGRNAAGNLVASGTYLFEVSSSAGHAAGRMAVIR